MSGRVSPASRTLSENENQNEVAHNPKPRSTFRSITIVASCTGALVTQIIGSTAVSVSLPVLGEEMGVAENQLQWLVSSYALSSGCLLVLFGRIADLHGRKHTFLAGLLWTLAFSIGCAFANDFVTLAILRGFQGLGLAAAVPSALGILAHAFAEGTRARSIAFSTFSAGAPLGAACGGVIGGVLVETTEQTWRSSFYFTAGLVALFLISGYLSFDKDVPEYLPDRRVDWIGALLITSGLVLIVFVLGQGELAPKQWETPYIIALLIVGVLLVVLFGFWQKRLERIHDTPDARLPEKGSEALPERKEVAPPLMKLSMWSRAGGRYGVMMAIAFLTYTAFNTWYFWQQLYYQAYFGLSPIHAAIRFLPMPVTGVLCNICIALVIGRVPMVVLLFIGTTFTCIACLLFAIMNPSTTYWAYQFPASIISVFGADFIFASGTIFVAKQSLPEEQSVTGALFQTMTQLGTAFGAAITTVVFNRVNGSQSTSSASLESYRAAWWMCLGFGAIGVVLSVVFFWNVGIIGHQKHKENESITNSEATA